MTLKDRLYKCKWHPLTKEEAQSLDNYTELLVWVGGKDLLCIALLYKENYYIIVKDTEDNVRQGWIVDMKERENVGTN